MAMSPPDDTLTKRLNEVRQKVEEVLRQEPQTNGSGKNRKVPIEWLLQNVGPEKTMRLMNVEPEG
jgi:hypothetical protein